MEYKDAVLDIISQVPSAPDFVIVRAMNRVARRFCDDTTAYRHTLLNVAAAANTANITITLPAYTAVNAVHLVRWGNKKLSPATDKFLATIGDNRLTGRPDYFLWREGTTITLFPTPQEAQEVDVEISLRPTRTATAIPEWFADKYYEVLVAGTCAELARTPDTEYTNEQLFGLMESYYNDGVIKARQEAYGADRAVPRKVRYGGY